MDELLTQFLIEGRELVADAEAELSRLAAEPDNAAALDALFRAVHTLKGSVAVFDMEPAEALLHRAEDRLGVARSNGAILGPDGIETLLACIDAIDRWIDELEQGGALGEDAASVAEQLIARLVGGPRPVGTSTAPVASAAEWVSGPAARAAAAIGATDQNLVAFRYTPDPDCFFRGDDPLALALAVPDLVDLAIVPVGGLAPIMDWDPFRCQVLLEGVSSAPIEAVRAAFRLVPDQLAFAEITPQPIETDAVVASDAARIVRVDGARLDRLADEVGELAVAANGLAHAVRRAEWTDPALAQILRALQGDIDRITGRLHHGVSAVRRVSLAASLRRLPRLVREIAQGVAKPVRFTMRGELTQVDKAIADGVFEPLLHIIRNALDHGLESAAIRQAAGKPVEGSLELLINRQGDEVVLGLSDDGAGIDPDRIRAAAVQRGILAAEAAAALSDAQALRLILTPGFSTAAAVTDLSGRGVGMDAVQRAVERLRGRLAIESRAGKGTRIEIRLPLDAITTRLLVVRAGDERYGIPLDQIVETARIAADAILPIGGGQACVLRDRTVPILDLASLLGRAATRDNAVRLVVTESGGELVAVRVAAFDAQIDALVREARGLLGVLPGIAGTALLGDGAVLLVLDLPELAA
ncbi:MULTISPECIES: chemotaxis protein CheA [unclassified Sphingomonas]|uniref:chemotaxis protein CheA n=1 Tax=unclassified Sphingomonas TaxID=196159 RepID=UPI0006FDA01F|nr:MULTISPECIES: chemotaxis protein CheA [unclassified Sphingomonas]KQX23270.1 chemotaxis protein CheA [Sphingomonas sp. Root1294]KQY68118.1 chemotaxis protein CheA [Sphingomonas sp. Root50]KRB91010.1 chemotaxis protein CheA [Sphingomonas sp. Root720]